MIHSLEMAVVSEPSLPAPQHQALAAAKPQPGVVRAALPASPWHSSSLRPTRAGPRSSQAHANHHQSGKSAAILPFTFFGPVATRSLSDSPL